MIFNSTHLKDIIKRFNDLATYYNFIISNFNFDVKNFYTEIDKDSLLRKLAFVINLYIQTHHSNVISISKFDKKLPPSQEPLMIPTIIQSISTFSTKFLFLL